MASSRGEVHMLAACSAAFACGAAAGAWLMRYYQQQQQQQQPSQHQQQHVRTVDLASLQGQGLPVAGGISSSPAPSVCSYSLPPTPRVSGSMNGRELHRTGSDSGLRMVFVVRRDLAWGRQKLSVMSAHAALALFKKLFKSRNPALAQWELAKGPKLVLRANDEQQLLSVLEAARGAGIPYHSIAEAVPAPGGGSSSSDTGGGPDVPRRSRTILAFGPLPADEIAKVAPGLVLL